MAKIKDEADQKKNSNKTAKVETPSSAFQPNIITNAQLAAQDDKKDLVATSISLTNIESEKKLKLGRKIHISDLSPTQKAFGVKNLPSDNIQLIMENQFMKDFVAR